ncbi:arylsulfatase [Pendulispora brunnea]|uniref:Arylsulfatase n=1 Tax=Pendulispora brunnea TaxID=2905690 RepID=A0ABZ2K4E9_9BACT
MILADDLGYSDIGAFGGEIATPNLDALAAKGRILTDYYAAPTCSPTRSELLSGTDHHLAGLGSMAEVMLPSQRGKPGYEGYLNERSLSIAELLRDGGYHTYMAGKWHLGLEESQSPKARGFESSFALLGGGGSHFAPVPGKPMPYDDVKYRENGVFTAIPADFFSTTFYTDKLVAYIDEHAGDGKPFFAYAAYTAPHWPLQAPPEIIDRYRGRYDDGFEPTRSRRVARLKRLGVIPAAFEPNQPLPSTPANPAWDDLTEEQKKFSARTMEVYAAMVEHLDANIGRLLQHLKEIGEYDDTFVFFQSDNGAEGSEFTFPNGPNVDNSYENIGRPLSNINYGARWAEVSAAPYRLWKGHSTEGGVRVPAIAHLPRQGHCRAAFRGLSRTLDLAPTFLQIANIPNPGSRYGGREVNPITGFSMLRGLKGNTTRVRPAGSVLADELFGDRYVRRDQWKITWVEPPLGSGRWQLFDLSTDGAEAHDKAMEEPVLFEELRAQWAEYKRANGVIPGGSGAP